MTRRLLGLGGKWNPVFDNFGNKDRLAAIHHRATPSDLQHQMRWLVRTLGPTVVFKPYLYLALALVALGLAWRMRELRALVASGLLLQATACVVATSPDYRNSHWMVVTTCLVLAALAVRRKADWRA
jgi:hypothetical protein